MYVKGFLEKDRNFAISQSTIYKISLECFTFMIASVITSFIYFDVITGYVVRITAANPNSVYLFKQFQTQNQTHQKSKKRKKREGEREIGRDTSRDKRREFRFTSKCLIIGDLQWHFLELANQKGVVYEKRLITLSQAS